VQPAKEGVKKSSGVQLPDLLGALLYSLPQVLHLCLRPACLSPVGDTDKHFIAGVPQPTGILCSPGSPATL
jgi:hypothetical protein